jgi:hypothetical protein
VKKIKRNRRTARLLVGVGVLDVMDFSYVFSGARLQQIVLGHCRRMSPVGHDRVSFHRFTRFESTSEICCQ